MISLLNKLPKRSSPQYCFASTHATQQDYQSKFNYYCSLRIYQKRTMFELLNNIMINQCLKVNYLVDNGPSLVGMMYKVFGQTLANIVIKKTIGTVFTAGENINDLDKYISANQKFPLILNYCSEAIEGMQNKDDFYDHNSEVFRNIVGLCSKYNSKQHMVSFKISCMVALELLKKINDGKTLIVGLFDNISKGQNTITLSQIFEYFEQQGLKLTDQDKNVFISEVFGMKNEQEELDRVTYTYKFQPIFMFKNELNNNPIIQFCNKLNENEHKEFRVFVDRMKYILDPAAKNGVICMVDSEQSYLQQTIDTMTEQMQEYYNQNQVIVMNTLQNYLKSSGPRIDYEMQKAERYGTPVVFKMVRGAYLVEENKLAKQLNIESPINDGFDATTRMIERNLDKVIQNANRFTTKIFVASHNEQTIEFTKKEVQQYQVKENNDIMFAQLYGLSDHMSYSLADQGYNIYKYIPFGKTEIMIPYLLRRAQETKMVLQQSSLQTELLIDELKRRLYLK